MRAAMELLGLALCLIAEYGLRANDTLIPVAGAESCMKWRKASET